MNNFSGPWHRGTALVVWYLVLGSFGQVDGGRELGSTLMEVLGSGWAACCVQNWVGLQGQEIPEVRASEDMVARVWSGETEAGLLLAGACNKPVWPGRAKFCPIIPLVQTLAPKISHCYS